MNIDVSRKLDMAGRVREFIRAHAASEAGYPPVLTRLDELLTRADQIVARQLEGRVAARGARAHRRAVRRLLHTQLVHYLVAVGSAAARNQDDLAERFKLPATNSTNTTFLSSVKALLASAQAQQDLLVKAGMAPAALEELTRLVAEFEAASETARTARRDHIGARADLDLISAELSEQVKLLDGITRYRFGSDPEVMVEWKAARQVLGQRRNGEAPQPGDVKQAA